MASKNAAQNRKLRFAIVGLGHIVQVAALPGFKKLREIAEVRALVSSTPAKLKRFQREYKATHAIGYDEYEELLDSGEIDAVFIGLPNTMHESFSVQALKRGIHVLCEKPLAHTIGACERIIAAAEKGGAKLMTAYRLHSEPATLAALDIVKSKKLGDLRYFTSSFSYQIKNSNIRLDSKLAGGALFDIGIYCINAARMIFRDEPTAVFGTLVKGQDERFAEVDGTTTATLYFPGDRIATFTASFAATPRSWFEIVGSNGALRMEPAYEYADALGFTTWIDEKKKVHHHKKGDQFAAEIRYFCDAIRRRGKIEPDGREGLADVRIIQAIMESSRKREIVKLAAFDKSTYAAKTQERRHKPRGKHSGTVGVSRASL